MKIFRKVGFNNSGKIYFDYIKDDQVVREYLDFGKDLTLEFDFSGQFCTG